MNVSEQTNPNRTSKKAEMVGVNRKYRDTVFRMLFNDRNELLSLYNAVNDSAYCNAEDLEIVTLDNAIFMKMKNDVGFLFNFQLNLYEHQSTWTPNMPLRFLFYLCDELKKLTAGMDLYHSRQVTIPEPRFIVFYNGIEETEEQKTLLLSNLYEKQVDSPELELRVTWLNINAGCNSKIMDACRTLREYTQYVDRIRRYRETMDIRKAVHLAVDDCIREGILSDFLLRQKSEAIAMSIYEYDEEQHLRNVRDTGFEQGLEQGREQGIEQGLAQGLAQGISLGEEKQLVTLACRKLKKGLSVEEIAEELEADLRVIRDIAEVAGKWAPEYPPEEVFKDLQEAKSKETEA